MHQPHLLPRIQKAYARALHGYVRRLNRPSDVEMYIASPGLGDQSGVIGALHLAQVANQSG
jgi:fructokinase